MTNSWSFLSDELNMSNQDYWEGDGLSIVGNPGAASPDTIVFSSSHLPGGMGNDHITFTGNGIKAAETVPIDYFGSGDNISFDVSAVSPVGRRITYAVLPEYQNTFSIDSISGLVSFKNSQDYEDNSQPKTYNLQVIITDFFNKLFMIIN